MVYFVFFPLILAHGAQCTYRAHTFQGISRCFFFSFFKNKRTLFESSSLQRASSVHRSFENLCISLFIIPTIAKLCPLNGYANIWSAIVYCIVIGIYSKLLAYNEHVPATNDKLDIHSIKIFSMPCCKAICI